MDTLKIGQFISEHRKSRQMTQKQLAERLNITDKAISKWERGQSCPDISLLTPLSEALGVTVGELLNGEKDGEEESDVETTVDKALQYASTVVKKNRLSLQNIITAAFTLTLWLGIVTCAIVDLAITGRFTWSLIPISSIVFAFAVFFPVVRLGLRGVLGSLIALSVMIWPYLYVLDSVIPAAASILPIGIRMAVIAVAYCWALFLLLSSKKIRKLVAAAISLLLVIPLELAINIVLSVMIGEALVDVWDVLTLLILVSCAAMLFSIDYFRKRRQVE